MSDFTTLVRTPLPVSVRAERGIGNLPRLSVSNDHGTAEVYFQGAHITAWRPAADPTPVIWMSRRSLFAPGRPIRGGVPICFPWFGAHRTDAGAPVHGFARLHPWTLVGASEDSSGTVTLEMELTGDSLSPHWPFGFRVVHRIRVGSTLRMDLEVHNPGTDAFTFEEALHTYLGVRDVRGVAVTGLEDTEYLDKVAGFTRQRQPPEPVRITGETDRIYLDTRAPCVLHDSGNRQITITKTGSDATVVWNPWIDKSRAMPDFGDDEWPEMICVETCNANAHALTLAPGESHTMTAVIETSAPPV